MYIRVYLCIIGLKNVHLFLGMPSLNDFLNTSRLDDLTGTVIDRVRSYHSMFDQPLTGTYWEELLSKSFNDIGYATTWKPDNSHKVGEDLKVVDLIDSRISCKSGVFKNNRTHNLGPCVEFSSSRTTSHDTLDEKLEHLSCHNYDFHFMLTKDKIFDRRYELLIISADMCKVRDLEWESNSNGKHGNYTSKVGGPFKATITESMSGQLWVTLPLNRTLFRKKIDLK